MLELILNICWFCLSDNNSEWLCKWHVRWILQTVAGRITFSWMCDMQVCFTQMKQINGQMNNCVHLFYMLFVVLMLLYIFWMFSLYKLYVLVFSWWGFWSVYVVLCWLYFLFSFASTVTLHVTCTNSIHGRRCFLLLDYGLHASSIKQIKHTAD